MVSDAPLHLNSLQLRRGLLVDLWSGELIDRSTTRNGYIFISVGLHRPTLGPPKTERSSFRTLRPLTVWWCGAYCPFETSCGIVSFIKAEVCLTMYHP